MSKFSALNQIKFDKDYLNKLTQDPSSGVCKQNCKYHIALHPAQFANFGESIKDELSRKIAKYDDIFQGIMLGYESIKLQSELGVIGIDNCYVHIDIQADFFIFKPEIGMILKGVVTRTTRDHVGCLVYSTFNISLPKPEDVDDSWLGNKASIKNDVVFKIIYADLTARLPYIRGELLSVLNESSSKKGKKLNKKITFENGDEEEDSVPVNATKKHKKRHRKDDESMEVLEMNYEDFEEGQMNMLEGDEEEETISEPKKRHKKKNNAVNETLEASDEDFEEDVLKKIKIEDCDEEADGPAPEAKKKNKKSHSSEDIFENVEIKQEDHGVEEGNRERKKHKRPKIVDDFDNSLTKRDKRREKKNRQVLDESESLGIESLFDGRSEANTFESHTTKKITFENGDEQEDSVPPKPTKKHKKRHRKKDESMEVLKMNYEDCEEGQINMLEGNEEDETISEPKKRYKNRHNVVNETLEAKDEDFEEDMPKKIKIEDCDEEADELAPKAKKKNKKSHSSDDIFGNLEIKQEDHGVEEGNRERKKHKRQEIVDDFDNSLTKSDKRREKKKRQELDESESLGIESLFDGSSEANTFESYTLRDTTAKSKDKHKKRYSKDDQPLEDVKIKQEDLEEDTINQNVKKHKRNKSDNDEEVLEKKEKRKEKKKRQDQDEEDISLGSLDLKSLFDGSSISVNSFHGTTMANDQDRGRKRRKSISISEQVKLEKIKLEEDSEMETILFGKKKK